MGTIPGRAGMRIVITKLGICGDSRTSSGSNRFVASGGGLNFSWFAGQTNPGGTYQLSPTPEPGGDASTRFTYRDVTHRADVGASVTIRWDYHYDWDGRWCNDTDSEGNTYNDTNYRSSIRAWVKYRYE